MRATVPLLLVSLLCASPAIAEAKDDKKELDPRGLAKRLHKVMDAKDDAALKRLSTPAFAKILQSSSDPLTRLKSEGATLQVVRPELVVNGLRALVGCKVIRGGEAVGLGVWLQLERVGSRWGLAGVIDTGAPAKLWLAGGLKGSSFTTPGAVVEALRVAINDQKKEQARATSTEHVWNEPGDTIASLYRQAVRKRFVLKASGAPLTKGDRSVATVDVVREGKLLDRVFLYLIKRGKGWLIDGIDENKRRGALFLAKKEDGKLQPKRPTRLVTAFLNAARHASRVQSKALWVADDWTARGLKLFTQRIAPNKWNFRMSADPQAQGERAFVSIEQRYQEEVDLVFHLLLAKKPAGWRIVGWTKSVAQAREHLTPKK